MNKTNKPKFGIRHTPVGSIVEIQVTGTSSPPELLTVAAIIQNDINSYVLQSDDPHPTIEGIKRAYNVDHVTAIVKRGTGSCAPQSNVPQFRREVFQKYYYGDGEVKHHSQYGAYSLREVIILLATEMSAHYHVLDGDKLVDQVWKLGIIRRQGYCGVCRVSKKRLRQAVRRLLPHCYRSKKRAIREYEDPQWERDDLDYDYMEDRNLTLPQEFLTNFDLRELPVYKEAVAEYGDNTLEVQETGVDGEVGMGSLWFYGKSDPDKGLSDFWRLFESVRARHRADQRMQRLQTMNP